jgi:uncharacterized protein (TIGR02145 family)
MTSTKINHKVKAGSILGLFLVFIFAYQACQTLEADNPLLISVDHWEFVSEGSYKITGTLASLGDKAIIEHGICWSESANPDLECSSVELGPPSSAGEFSATLSGLSPSTIYYFRAFAVMDAITDYSEEKAFTTRPAAEDMVMDVDGNIYRTVKIGEQTWMADNLKSTMYADRTPVPYVEDHAEWYDFTRESEGYSWYGNVLTHGYAYGGLYTWAAATAAHDGIKLIEEGVQGVCPDGWHLPSDDEWKQLEMHLGMSQEETDASKWRGEDQGGMLKQEGIKFWRSPNTGASDKYGFNALPGGYRHGSGEFEELSNTTRFWTSTANGYSYAWYRRIDYDTAAVYRDFTGVYRGHSIRCVKDD